jgi:MFS transporter, DHA1 family, tetracycline resistance protein
MQDSRTAEETFPSSAPAANAPATSNRSALLIVFVVVFIDLLGFGIVLPLLPRFGDAYVEVLIPGGKENRLGGAVLGLLMSSFSLMQFIFAPVWGRVSDRVGRRPILLLGLVGSVLFYALFGYASSLPSTAAGLALTLLFISRAGAGVAGATIATAQAVIADCTPPEKRRHGMALIGAAFGIGFTFGPLIGFAALKAFAVNHDVFTENHAVVGYTAALLSLLAYLLGLRLLPETRRFESAPPLDRRWLNWSALRMALATSALAPVILTFFLATLGFGAFEVTLALLLKDALDFSEDNSFLVFAYVGFILLLAQGVLYRRLARRFTEPTFIGLGIVLMAVGVASLGSVSWVAYARQTGQIITGNSFLMTLLLISLATAVVGFAFLTPSAQALVSRRSAASQQGEILGVNQSASALARILGPIFGLTLYKLTDAHLLPYIFGAALLLLMLPLLPRIKRG